MLQQPFTPIIIKVIEKPTPERTVADVLLEAIGLTGVFVLLAVLVGLIAGGIFIAVKRHRGNHGETTGPTRLGLDARSA